MISEGIIGEHRNGGIATAMDKKKALILSLIVAVLGIVITIAGGPIMKSDKAFFYGLIIYAIGSYAGALLSGDKSIEIYKSILGYSAPNVNVGCIATLFLPITMALIMAFSLFLMAAGWIFAIKALIEGK